MKMAFVSAAPVFGKPSKRVRCGASPRLFARPLRKGGRQVIFACASPESADTDESAEGNQATEPVKTLQEKMAEKIGRNVEEEREKGRQVIADSEKEMRQNYLIAAMAVVLALGIFTEEKLNPVNPLALMRMLEERSVPVSSVGNGTPSVLEFYAPWCESCKLMARDMFELEGRYVGAVNFVTVNSEEADYDLLDRYDVTGVPTVVFADKDGKVITNLIGKIPRGILEQDFDALMRSKPLPYTADVDDEENMALFPADNGVQEIKSSSF